MSSEATRLRVARGELDDSVAYCPTTRRACLPKLVEASACVAYYPTSISSTTRPHQAVEPDDIVAYYPTTRRDIPLELTEISACVAYYPTSLSSSTTRRCLVASDAPVAYYLGVSLRVGVSLPDDSTSASAKARRHRRMRRLLSGGPLQLDDTARSRRP